MSLAGRIEEIELAEILHFLALNSRTGKLTLSRRDAHGTIVLRLGRVLYAVSSSIHETLGSLLVCRGLVTPTALAGALERQHASADRRKLGLLLVESGAITAEQLHDALWQQTALVVQELCGWRSGYFSFEIGPVAATGDIGVDVEDLVVSAGVPTDQLLLEAMTRIDEGHPAEHAPSALDVIASARAPSLRGEVTAGLLRRAAGVVRRGLLMVVRAEEVQGIAQVGLVTDDEPDARSRSIRISLAEPSAVAEAVERRQTRRGPLQPTASDLELLAALGGVRPNETIVVPMLLHDRGGLLFYGDDAADGCPLGDARELEWELLEAGLGMERDMLDQRLRDFERARGYRP